MRKSHRRVLWGFVSFGLALGIFAGSTPVFSRYLQTTSSNYVLSPVETSQTVQTGAAEYLQPGGNTVWLAPWALPEYQSTPSQEQTAQLSKTYSFRLKSTAAVTAEGNSYIRASVTRSGNAVNLTLSLTDSGRSLLTAKKVSVKLTCGDISGTFYIWLLPQGTEIPKDSDSMPVELTQICKKQTQSIHLTDGKAFLLLDGTDRNAYQLTFLVGSGAAQGLRYSLDAGETYTQLHDWNQLRLPRQASETALLVLDYSACALNSGSTAKIQIQRQNDDEKKVQTVTMGVTSTNPGDSLKGKCLLVTPQKPLAIPVAWNGCEVDLQLQQLVDNGDALSYRTVQIPQGLICTRENGVLTLSLDSEKGTPAAGTYRICIQWKFEGVVCSQVQLPLFINYAFV